MHRELQARLEIAQLAIDAQIAREHRDCMRDRRGDALAAAYVAKKIIISQGGEKSFPPEAQEAHRLYRSAAAAYAAKRAALTRAIKKLNKA